MVVVEAARERERLEGGSVMETWIDVGGLRIASPVTAFTNLCLSVQCFVYWRALRTGRADRAGYWALFFIAMAVATLAGVPKHGLRHLLATDVYTVVLWVSSLGSAASVYFAQRATLPSRTAGGSDWPERLSVLQLVVFVAVSVLLGPEMWLLVANTVIGLVPVVVAESLAAARGSTASARVAWGLGVSLFTGVVYVGGFSLGPWFNHVDIAHVLMGSSFWLLVRGARPGERGRPEPFMVGGRSGRARLAGLKGDA